MSARAFKTLFGLGRWRRGQALVAVINERGIEAFNRVRSRNPTWLPDFEGADLRDMDLTLANLRRANLIGAQIDGVILDGLALEGDRARNALARRDAAVE